MDAYLASADYLIDEDLPLVVALKQAALELDTNGVQAALLNTFGVTYRALRKKAGQNNGDADPQLEFLDSL
ncbi:hypothetical protein [Nocardioides sp. Leaf307]|uniref:hypothetical protein n=1 Tax=Nocardioides sp. Leaf307 TaxID=1736331 RepID=UPI0012E9D349|nr:hypothetical protein [Nocardioides sp. Leaf307]